MSAEKKLENIALLINEKDVAMATLRDKFRYKDFGEGETEEILTEQFSNLEKEKEGLLEEMKKLSIMAMVESQVKSVQEYLPFAKEIAEMVQGEVGNTLKLLLGLLLDTRKQLEGELNQFSDVGAKALFRDRENLRKAGFKKPEANQIILARICKSVPFASSIETVTKTAEAAANIKR